MNLQPQPTDKQFLHQYIPGALLPLVQSLTTAAITFVAALVITWIIFPKVIDVYKPAAVISVIALVVTWTTRQKMWMSLAQWERLTGIDINQDGRIGDADEDSEPEPKIQKIRIDLSKITSDGHYSSSSFDLPKGVTEEHLAGMAHDMFILGKSFAETELSGTGRISLPKFRQLRAVMERQELCEKTGTHSNASFELTDAGEAWLRTYLPPFPIGGGHVKRCVSLGYFVRTHAVRTTPDHNHLKRHGGTARPTPKIERK